MGARNSAMQSRSDGGGKRWDVGVLGAAANDEMLAFWGRRRTMRCWRFGGMGEDPMEGGRGVLIFD